MKKLFMVFVEFGSSSTKQYESLDDAETEAKRLCGKTGQRTYVLETYCVFEMATIKKTIL